MRIDYYIYDDELEILCVLNTKNYETFYMIQFSEIPKGLKRLLWLAGYPYKEVYHTLHDEYMDYYEIRLPTYDDFVKLHNLIKRCYPNKVYVFETLPINTKPDEPDWLLDAKGEHE